MTIDEMTRKFSDRKITKDEMERQIALGYGWGKRLSYPNSDGIIRWLEDNEIIKFTSPKFTSRNVEFEINNDPNHKIWLSQLQGLFMNENEKGTIYLGKIYLRDKTEILARSLLPENFWEIVRDKKFQVSIDEDAHLLIDEQNERVRIQLLANNNDYFKIVDFILNKLETKEYNLIKGMTRQGRCYDLREI